MASMTIELSEYVIDAIADAVVNKMQKPCSCEYYDAENQTCRRSEVPQEPCDDAISGRMTREEAIEHLKNMAEHSYPNEEYLMAIKALEQEPILDKIRAEIDGAKMPKNRMSFFRDGIECALEIIDKYKAEKQ